jgi:glycerophosphoryl diester phosphodiesterase
MSVRSDLSRRRGVIGAPLLIAHRAGNDPAHLRAAERAGADVIEADLHLWRGGLVLRHLKTVGSLPVYWDRWALAPPWRRFPSLGDLLTGVQPESALMLDLKGSGPAGARLLSAALAQAARRAPVFVSARSWPLLDGIDPALAHRVASAARPGQLDRLIKAAPGHGLHGASLHLRLLERGRLDALREHAPVVMTWPVNHRHEAEHATALGVDGLISDDLALLGALREERSLRRASADAQDVAQGERAEHDHQREQPDGQVEQRDAELHADPERDDARG